MRAGILLSVREKATRLPGKVLLPLGKYNITEHLVRRLQQSQLAENVVVSTSTDKRDKVFVDLALKCDAGFFQGSEDDKLLRYRDTARYFKFDFVVIVDGDDPFCSVEHIDGLIEYAQHNPVDYVIWEGLPLGVTWFGVGLRALEKICEAKKASNTEVWGHLFTKNPAFKCVTLKETNPLYNRPDIRMTLDYPEDYKFFKTVADALAERGMNLDFASIMHYVNDFPQVAEINRNVQKAYEAHLNKSLS